MFLPIALGIFFAAVALCFVLLAKALKADRAAYDRARGVTPDAFLPPPVVRYVPSAYQPGSGSSVVTMSSPVVIEREDPTPLIDALTVVADIELLDALAAPSYDPAPSFDPPADLGSSDATGFFDGGASGGGGGGSDW